MSIVLSGTFTKSGGLMAAVAKQVRMLNFKGIKRVTVQFDPFHEKAAMMRDFLSFVSSPKLANNCPNFTVKTDIVCNRAAPSIVYHFIPAVAEAEKVKTVRIEADNFDILDILKATNLHVSTKAPKQEPVSTLKTKSEKKGVGKKK